MASYRLFEILRSIRRHPLLFRRDEAHQMSEEESKKIDAKMCGRACDKRLNN